MPKSRRPRSGLPDPRLSSSRRTRNRRSPIPPFPRSFRGAILEGERAEEAASLVSGPFHLCPAAYVSPTDRDDLALLVQWASRHGVALTARGSGTGMPGGNLGPAVVVSLAESGGFDDVEVDADGDGSIIRSGAAAIAARVDSAARTRNRFLPPLPSSAAWCSVGGMAANNAAGARSFRYGAASSWISALEGMDAAGDAFRLERSARKEGIGDASTLALDFDLPTDADGRLVGWPRVRKNSSGYALDRFFESNDALDLLVGSEGTLGILTAVEWRTAPIPASRGVAVLPARTSGEVASLALGAAEIGATACEFLGRRFLEISGLRDDPRLGSLASDAYALLFLEMDGSPEEVRTRLGEAGELGRGIAGPGVSSAREDEASSLWSLRHAASPIIARQAGRGLVSSQFIEDSVVPVRALGQYLDGLDAILAEGGLDAVVFGHAGDGNVHVNPLVDVDSDDWERRIRRVLADVVRLVSELGGTLAGEHGDGRLRAPYLETIWGRPLVDAFRLVKSHYDPKGILNPGVVLPVPDQDPFEHFRPRRRAFPSKG